MYIYKCKQQLYRLAPLSVIPFNCSKPYIQPIRKSLCMSVRHRITLHATIFCCHCCCILLIKKTHYKNKWFQYIYSIHLHKKVCKYTNLCWPVDDDSTRLLMRNHFVLSVFYLFLSLYLLSTSLSFFKKKKIQQKINICCLVFLF